MVTLGVAISGLLLGLVYSLVALGLTVSFRLMRVVNFAHGEWVILFAYLAFWLDIPPVAKLFVLTAAGALTGAAFYGLLGRRLARLPEHSQFLLFISLATVLVNCEIFLFGADMVSGGEPQASFNWHGLLIDYDRLLAATLALIAVGLLWLVFFATSFGRRLRACVDNIKAARVWGMNPHLIFIGGFALSFACIALAALFLSRLFDANPLLGPHLTLISFMTVILAGERYISGILIAGVVVGLSEALLGYFLGSNFKVMCTYIFILILMAFRAHRSQECYT